ncbi:MAG: hypothetical protein ACRD10_01450 [Terriglobia bacterium]
MKKLILVPVLAAVVLIAACTASQIQEAEQLAGVLLQDVPQLVILFGGAHLTASQTAQVKSAFADADASYALLKTALDDYKTAGPVTTAQKVQFAIAEAQKDLTPVLAIAGQNNPQLSAGIELALNTGAQIAAIFPSAATPAALKASNRVTLPSAQDVDAQFKKLL